MVEEVGLAGAQGGWEKVPVLFLLFLVIFTYQPPAPSLAPVCLWLLTGHAPSTNVQVINRRIVEPNRRWIDLQKIYRNKHIAKVREDMKGTGFCTYLYSVSCLTLLALPVILSCHTATSTMPRCGGTYSFLAWKHVRALSNSGAMTLPWGSCAFSSLTSDPIHFATCVCLRRRAGRAAYCGWWLWLLAICCLHPLGKQAAPRQMRALQQRAVAMAPLEHQQQQQGLMAAQAQQGQRDRGPVGEQQQRGTELAQGQEQQQGQQAT